MLIVETRGRLWLTTKLSRAGAVPQSFMLMLSPSVGCSELLACRLPAISARFQYGEDRHSPATQ